MKLQSQTCILPILCMLVDEFPEVSCNVMNEFQHWDILQINVIMSSLFTVYLDVNRCFEAYSSLFGYQSSCVGNKNTVASFQQLILYFALYTPMHVSAGVSENKSLLNPIPYPYFQKQLTGRGNVCSHASLLSSF